MSLKVGFFDSGVGGLTVAKAVSDALPEIDLVYFGDTAHFPYGNKSKDAIGFFALKITRFLIDKGCRIIVIACNSASAAAYSDLKIFFEREGIVVINVVDPLVSYIIKKGYKKVGLIATDVTVSSGIYERKLKEGNPLVSVESLATPLLAPMIEEGFVSNSISNAVLDNYLSVDRFEKIETLLLACTHYPLLKKEIQKFWNNSVDIWDSTDVIVDEITKYLDTTRTKDSIGTREFIVSDKSESFERATEIFYGKKIKLEKVAFW